MKKFLYILLVVILTGCGSFFPKEKKKTRTKMQITERNSIVETGRRIEFVPEDSLIFIPEPELKGDTIQSVENKQMKIEATVKNGRIKKVKATQKPKITVTDYKRTEQQEKKTDIKQTQTVKESKWKDEYFIYIFLGLALLVVVNNLTKKS